MTDVVDRLNVALEGRYRVERKLGEGGMATVYLATDLRHNRNVALKVLKPELAAVVGAERFLAEIETTAKLQHPHILPLFDSGEADGFLFYVMPYIEGETLGDRIAREKQLPVDEALGIATAVAHALQTAHDQGVVHRDIKPGNILLSRGQPLVADFGIALAVGAAGGSRLTETGLSVGTPYYMSPEQATGDQLVGPASDMYALACVLYEMLVGEPPYLGNTAQAVLGKIIQGLPVSATAVRRSVPVNVDAAIRRALEKLPADRFTDAQGFARALADPTFRHGEGEAAAAVGAGPWKRIAMAASIVALGALGLAGWVAARSTDGSAPVARMRLQPLSPDIPRAIGAFTALAPDGSSMVYARLEESGIRLWLKARGSAEATLLQGTEGAQNVVYSPDGSSIAFATGSELRRRPIGDGSTIRVAEGLVPVGPGSMNAIAWLDDGTILYEAPDAVLMRVPESGGAADTVAAYGAQGFTNLAFAGPLPGSDGALVTVCPGPCGAGISLAVVDFQADTTRVLLDAVVRGWYAPTGDLVYVRTDGSVFAAPFDLRRLELTGPGVPLFEGVQINVSTPELVVGMDGTVLYATGSQSGERRGVVWVDRAGTAVPVDASLTNAFYVTATLSPDEGRLALVLAEGGGTPPAIWVKELPDGPLTRLTTELGAAEHPVWSPDGRYISYIASGLPDRQTPHVRRIVSDGSSQGASELVFWSSRPVWELLPTPDETSLIVREGAEAQGDADLMVADLSTDTAKVPLLASDFNEYAPMLSPDARWLAYVSDPSGRDEVFVRPFPEGSSRVQVSTSGGVSPVWAPGGNELFYAGDGAIWVATYRTEPTFAVESRTRLFSSDGYSGDASWRVLDVSREGGILMIRSAGSSSGEASTLVLVQGFFEELRQRVGR